MAKALIEQRGPWMLLRATDTSKTVTTGNTWQTAIDLSTIARFNRFYGDDPIQLFDGNRNVVRFRQLPWNLRLQYKDTPHTFVYDEANKTLYLNGTVPFAGRFTLTTSMTAPPGRFRVGHTLSLHSMPLASTKAVSTTTT
jgi:hypothetical protein